MHATTFRSFATLLAAGLGMAACDGNVTVFSVPSAVWAGHDFVVMIRGDGYGTSNLNGSIVGAVVQLPLGFTVVARGVGAVVDDPQLLAMYTPEPGAYLTSLSGFVNSPYATAQLTLRAPATLGVHALKVALATDLGTSSAHASSPQGVTNFAQITAAPNVQTTVVQAGPAGAYATESLTFAPPTSRPILADVDGDGRDDLIVPAGPRVWLSRPGGAWIDVSPAPVTGPDVAAAGDFDGDGHLDFVHGSGSVWFGDGAGNWTRTSIQPPTSGAIVTLATGDFDRDGHADIAECDANGWVRVLRCTATRTFVSRSFGLPGSGQVQPSLTIVDVDGDGLPDLVGSYGIWRGNGSGTWSLDTNALVGGSRTAVGDLTGDGVPEIVCLNHSTSGDVVVYTRGSGTQWTAMAVTGLPTSLPNGDQRALALLDFDGDGRLDVVLGNTGVQLWRNMGGARFNLVPASGLPPVLAASNQATGSIDWLAVGDRDGDGLPELLAAPALATDWQVLLFENMTTGVLPFGAGCSAPGFAPQLAGIGRPSLGNASFAITLQQGAANGLGLCWLGASRHGAFGQSLPFSLATLGAPGCSVVAEPLVQLLVALDPSGAATTPVPVPNDPNLQFASFFAQAAAIVPGANALGLLTTNGLAIRIE